MEDFDITDDMIEQEETINEVFCTICGREPPPDPDGLRCIDDWHEHEYGHRCPECQEEYKKFEATQKGAVIGTGGPLAALFKGGSFIPGKFVPGDTGKALLFEAMRAEHAILDFDEDE